MLTHTADIHWQRVNLDKLRCYVRFWCITFNGIFVMVLQTVDFTAHADSAEPWV